MIVGQVCTFATLLQEIPSGCNACLCWMHLSWPPCDYWTPYLTDCFPAGNLEWAAPEAQLRVAPPPMCPHCLCAAVVQTGTALLFANAIPLGCSSVFSEDSVQASLVGIPSPNQQVGESEHLALPCCTEVIWFFILLSSIDQSFHMALEYIFLTFLVLMCPGDIICRAEHTWIPEDGVP